MEDEQKPHRPPWVECPDPFPPGHIPHHSEGFPPPDWKEIPPDWKGVPPDWKVVPPSGKKPPEPPDPPPGPRPHPGHRPRNPHEMKHMPRDNYCCAQDWFMADHEIQNIPQLIAYIKGQLGSPVTCVEISDSQIIDIIRDTVQYIQRYYYREGNYRDYLCMELLPGKTHYKLCQELESVVDFQTASWLGNINELFTIPHNILYDQMMGMNSFSYNGMCYGDSSYGDVMGNFNAQLIWLEQVKFDLGESYQVRYNMKEKELSVWPTPRKKVHGLIEVVKKQKSFKIFNDYWFKELVVCKAGMIWTNSLRKYSLSIAGGGQLNGDSLYSSYKERYDAAIERIDKESPHRIYLCRLIMELNEAKELLEKNGYLVESDNYVKDFTDDVIEPLDAIIVGLKFTIQIGGEDQIDAKQLVKDLSEIKDKCVDTRKLLKAFNIKG